MTNIYCFILYNKQFKYKNSYKLLYQFNFKKYSIYWYMRTKFWFFSVVTSINK